jgi:hypothetical protein
MHLAVPVKAVSSIRLTDLRIPIIGAHTYVAVVVSNLNDDSMLQTIECGGYPRGLLAIVPLIPAAVGATYAYYQPISGGSGWKLDFPIAMAQLYELHIEIFAWGGAANIVGGWGGPMWPTIYYPLPAEALGAPASLSNNLFHSLEVEHAQ